MMDKTTYGPFIGRACTIVKQTKGGLYNVFLNADPRKRISVAQRNITLTDVTTTSELNEEHEQ